MISHLFHVISHLFYASAGKRNHPCVFVVACHLGRGSTVSWQVPASRVARRVVIISYPWTVWPCFFFPGCFDLNSCLVYSLFSTALHASRSRRDLEEGGGAGPSSWPRRDHEEGGGAGLRKLDFFRFELFLNSSATDIVFVTLPSKAVKTATAQCTSHCAMARGHRLNTSIVLEAVHGLSGLFRAVSAVEPSLFRPLSLPPAPSRP